MECFSSSCSLMLHDFSLLLREYYVASILSVFFLLTVDFLILNVNFLFLFLLMLVSAEIVVQKFVIWNIVLLSSESSLLFFYYMHLCTYSVFCTDIWCTCISIFSIFLVVLLQFQSLSSCWFASYVYFPPAWVIHIVFNNILRLLLL